MKIVIDGTPFTFEKYSDKPKEVVNKYKKYKKCDVNGKELTWVPGKSGTYKYADGTEFNGKRTDVYYMDENGNVIPKVERTVAISLKDAKETNKKFVDDLAATADFFSLDDNEFLKEKLKDDNCFIFPIVLSDGYETNAKIAVVYRDMDGVVTMKVGSTLKSKQKAKAMEKTRIKGISKKLTSKKLVKKVDLSSMGLDI